MFYLKCKLCPKSTTGIYKKFAETTEAIEVCDILFQNYSNLGHFDRNIRFHIFQSMMLIKNRCKCIVFLIQDY